MMQNVKQRHEKLEGISRIKAMQLLCKMGAWIMRYVSSKSSQEDCQNTVQSPLEAPTDQAIRWPAFITRSRAAGDAKNATNN